jgi:ATP-dependent 26S proteasome regulatory subunit
MKMVKDNIEKYIESKIPVIYIKGMEFSNIYKIINSVANNLTITDIEEYNGAVSEIKKNNEIKKNAEINEFLKDRIEKGKTQKIITILKDCEKEIFESSTYLLIKNSAEKHIEEKEFFNLILIMSSRVAVPSELLTYINFVEIPAPDEKERKKIIEEYKNEKSIIIDKKSIEKLTYELRGMEKFQILKLLNLINSDTGQSIEQIIFEERENMIKKSEVLELINSTADINEVGGAENIKEWLRKKSKIYHELDKAREFGVEIPKGILLSGIHGCGKSLLVKGTGKLFDLQVIRLDMVKFIGGESWNSELKLVEALKIVERVSPCVLWIDDIENSFRGLWISLKEEEIIMRVFSRLIGWLKERKENIFTIATVNDLEILPVEFIKRGSFDECFFMDLPDEKERKEIFELILKKKNKFNERIGMNEISQKSEGMSGSEIEKAVNNAIEESFIKETEDIDTRDILKSLSMISKYSEMNKEKVNKIIEISKRINSIKANGIEKSNTKYSEKFALVESGIIISEEIKIELLYDFYMAKYQITQKEFEMIMGFNPSYFKGDDLPVEQLSWYDAVLFCNMKSIKEGLKPFYKISDIKKEFNNIISAVVEEEGGNGYRLPTSEEWEFAARGGIKSKKYKYSGSNDIDEVAWYYGDSGSISHEVGVKLSNELGIYDMSGNVWEWTNTGYGTNRVFRGGSWYDSFTHCEINTWNDSEPGFWFIYVGFRVARNK